MLAGLGQRRVAVSLCIPQIIYKMPWEAGKGTGVCVEILAKTRPNNVLTVLALYWSAIDARQ